MRLGLDAVSPHLPLDLPDLSDQIADVVRHPTVTMVSAPMLYQEGDEAIARHELTQQLSLQVRIYMNASAKYFQTTKPSCDASAAAYISDDALHCSEMHSDRSQTVHDPVAASSCLWIATG